MLLHVVCLCICICFLFTFIDSKEFELLCNSYSIAQPHKQFRGCVKNAFLWCSAGYSIELLFRLSSYTVLVCMFFESFLSVFLHCIWFLQCFHTVGWAAGRASGL